MNDLDSLKFQLEVERTNYLRNAEELVRQRDEARGRADKAESDLAACLAVTNEALQEALAHGRETDEGPNRAFVQGVRAAYRLGAEEMREKAARWFDASAKNSRAPWQAQWAAGAVRALPLPGDEVKPKRAPSHSMHCMPEGLDVWRCAEGCTVRKEES